MCGIAGWIGFREQTSPLLHLDLLSHRGPDDRGEEKYLSASQRVAASLGSTRLAILDLSAAGHMPMKHPEEPLSLVHNGEIYNFPELRRELEAAGECFFSRTDTEVILRGYRIWGDSIVERLRGMFAFALWDGRGDGRLLLARDSFGKKPLYYRHVDGQGIAFSSELKSLLNDNRPRYLDPEGLEYYLDRGHLPPDRCLLQGFRKVLPGRFLVWEKGQITEQHYWKIPKPLPGESRISLQQAGTLLREHLVDATRRRLVADVPVGLLLSGGVDSSSLLALMARWSHEQVRTYTTCFGGSSLDESELARQTARHFNTRHHALLINPRCGRLLPFVASQMDDPVADPSALATYILCRRAREEVTVLLTGDGSDELLLGYPRYRLHALSHILTRMLPLPLRQAFCRLLPPRSKIERTLSAPQDPLPRDRYWLDHGQRRQGSFSRGERRTPISDAVLQVLEEDISSWLVENILLKIDKMSMAASIEIRAPFLDQEVANLILTLPLKVRLGFSHGKLALAEALKDLLPKHISWSRKRPFHLPIDDWLRCEWRPLLQDVLLDVKTGQRGWIEAQEIRRLIEEHLTGRASHGRRLYQILLLELWARTLLDRGEPEPHPLSVEDCARELDPNRPIRRVAVIAPAGIGDTLRLTPGLKQLGRSDPNVSVTLYVTRGESDQVMAGQAPVDRHVPIDFASHGMGKFCRLLGDLHRNTMDCLVSTLVSRLAGAVGAFCGIRDRRAWVPQWSLEMRLGGLFWRTRIPYRPEKYDVGYQDALLFCKLLDVPAPANLSPSFAPPIWEETNLARARETLKKLPSPRLAVNAVAHASIPQRQYPLEGLAQALGGLLKDGLVNTLVLLGDKHSRECHGPLTGALGPQAVDLSGKLSLGASAALMGECDAVLTIDGGLFHVALSTSLPVVALFGPTDVYRRDPRGLVDHYRILSVIDHCGCEYRNHQGIRVREECRWQSQCLASLSPQMVKEAVASLLRPSLAWKGEDSISPVIERGQRH
jgi:asparagine synthase (glutamine-hydrolysing)